jgi:hypothetical protein
VAVWFEGFGEGREEKLEERGEKHFRDHTSKMKDAGTRTKLQRSAAPTTTYLILVASLSVAQSLVLNPRSASQPRSPWRLQVCSAFSHERCVVVELHFGLARSQACDWIDK